MIQILVFTLFLVVESYAQINHGFNTYPSNSNYTTSVSAIGSNNTIEGTSTLELTAGCFVSGYSNTIETGANSSHVLGERSKVGGFASFCLGHRAFAIADNSYSFGKYIKAIANGSMVIGSGYWSHNYNTNLINNIPNSLMIGFNSQIPTLFVGAASGSNTIGTVMIGTTVLPSQAQGKGYIFAVKGNMIAEKIKVATYINWADYVFDLNYDLMPLDEVEEYINENSHLPEVPSAKDIEENGYELAEMDATLLKKIEELYLYTLELKKDVEKLKEENKELKLLLSKMKKG